MVYSYWQNDAERHKAFIPTGTVGTRVKTFMKKIFYVAPVVLFIFITACLHNCKTVSDVMELKGFNKESSFFGYISDGKTRKNINQYIQPVLEAMKNSDIVTSISSSPSLHMHMQRGSYSPSQVIRFHISESGEGSIEYKDKKIAYFKNSSLYEIALDAFKKSNIILK